MKKILLLIFCSFFFVSNSNAACDDPLTDGVDYSKCRFSDGQDLQGSYLPNSNLSFASFVQVNLDKSIMMNSNLSFGTFPESTFVRANLYETISIGGNFEKTNFTNANLTRVDFMGATLIEANFDNILGFHLVINLLSILLQFNFTNSYSHILVLRGCMELSK